jgi:hypothetical protein
LPVLLKEVFMGGTERFDILLEGISGPEADKSIVCLGFGFGTNHRDILPREYLKNDGMNWGGMEDISPFTFRHRVDRAAPAIRRCCQDGRVLKSAIFRYKGGIGPGRRW